MAVLPLAAGIGAGNLTNAGDLHPTYRNAMLISAGLMVAGGVLAFLFVPTRLPAHTPATTPALARQPAVEAAPSLAQASPVRTFCDVAGPPVHPRNPD